ncbi:hypothetical protein IJ750_00425 [bacterium]|nr:hypothetical protein [bacterium]
MKINAQVLNCAKKLFNNPFKNGIKDKTTQAAILIPLCYSGVQGGLAMKDLENHDIKYVDRMLKGYTGLAAAAGGMFGIGGAIAAGLLWHTLIEKNREYFV